MYGARKPPQEPPCDTCRVNVLPENQEALNVYLTTRNQYIMSFNGPVAINQMAVWEVIDRFEVRDPVKVFHRVIHCGKVILSRQMENKDG